MNKSCSQYILAVIRAVMQETQVPERPEELTLEELYAFAKAHNVESLVYHGLCQQNPDPLDPLWKHWENRANMLLAQGVVQLNDRDELFAVLTNAGIPLLPFKGCWLKELYPNMEYRQMVDLDLLIPGEKAQEAKAIMLSLGYQTEAFEDAPYHAGYLKPPYTEVELHIRLTHQEERYYDNVWDRAQRVEGYPCLYRLRPEDEYIFYLYHLWQHLEDAGTGIRSILDCVVYRDVYQNLDREYLNRELEQLHLLEHARDIEILSDCWFKTGAPVPERLEKLAESILSAGSYGTMENRTRHRLEKEQAAYKNPVVRGIAYWLTRVCRPMEEMAQSYPALKKAPVLLPLFWIYRAGMRFAKHPKAVWHHVTLVFGKGKKHG